MAYILVVQAPELRIGAKYYGSNFSRIGRDTARLATHLSASRSLLYCA